MESKPETKESTRCGENSGPGANKVQTWSAFMVETTEYVENMARGQAIAEGTAALNLRGELLSLSAGAGNRCTLLTLTLVPPRTE